MQEPPIAAFDELSPTSPTSSALQTPTSATPIHAHFDIPNADAGPSQQSPPKPARGKLTDQSKAHIAEWMRSHTGFRKDEVAELMRELVPLQKGVQFFDKTVAAYLRYHRNKQKKSERKALEAQAQMHQAPTQPAQGRRHSHAHSSIPTQVTPHGAVAGSSANQEIDELDPDPDYSNNLSSFYFKDLTDHQWLTIRAISGFPSITFAQGILLETLLQGVICPGEETYRLWASAFGLPAEEVRSMADCWRGLRGEQGGIAVAGGPSILTAPTLTPSNTTHPTAISISIPPTPTRLDHQQNSSSILQTPLTASSSAPASLSASAMNVDINDPQFRQLINHLVQEQLEKKEAEMRIKEERQSSPLPQHSSKEGSRVASHHIQEQEGMMDEKQIKEAIHTPTPTPTQARFPMREGGDRSRTGSAQPTTDSERETRGSLGPPNLNSSPRMGVHNLPTPTSDTYSPPPPQVCRASMGEVGARAAGGNATSQPPPDATPTVSSAKLPPKPHDVVPPLPSRRGRSNTGGSENEMMARPQSQSPNKNRHYELNHYEPKSPQGEGGSSLNQKKRRPIPPPIQTGGHHSHGYHPYRAGKSATPSTSRPHNQHYSSSPSSKGSQSRTSLGGSARGPSAGAGSGASAITPNVLLSRPEREVKKEVKEEDGEEGGGNEPQPGEVKMGSKDSEGEVITPPLFHASESQESSTRPSSKLEREGRKMNGYVPRRINRTGDGDMDVEDDRTSAQKLNTDIGSSSSSASIPGIGRVAASDHPTISASTSAIRPQIAPSTTSSTIPQKRRELHDETRDESSKSPRSSPPANRMRLSVGASPRLRSPSASASAPKLAQARVEREVSANMLDAAMNEEVPMDISPSPSMPPSEFTEIQLQPQPQEVVQQGVAESDRASTNVAQPMVEPGTSSRIDGHTNQANSPSVMGSLVKPSNVEGMDIDQSSSSAPTIQSQAPPQRQDQQLAFTPPTQQRTSGPQLPGLFESSPSRSRVITPPNEPALSEDNFSRKFPIQQIRIRPQESGRINSSNGESGVGTTSNTTVMENSTSGSQQEQNADRQVEEGLQEQFQRLSTASAANGSSGDALVDAESLRRLQAQIQSQIASAGSSGGTPNTQKIPAINDPVFKRLCEVAKNNKKIQDSISACLDERKQAGTNGPLAASATQPQAVASGSSNANANVNPGSSRQANLPPPANTNVPAPQIPAAHAQAAYHSMQVDQTGQAYLANQRRVSNQQQHLHAPPYSYHQTPATYHNVSNQPPPPAHSQPLPHPPMHPQTQGMMPTPSSLMVPSQRSPVSPQAQGAPMRPVIGLVPPPTFMDENGDVRVGDVRNVILGMGMFPGVAPGSQPQPHPQPHLHPHPQTLTPAQMHQLNQIHAHRLRQMQIQQALLQQQHSHPGPTPDRPPPISYAYATARGDSAQATSPISPNGLLYQCPCAECRNPQMSPTNARAAYPPNPYHQPYYPYPQEQAQRRKSSSLAQPPAPGPYQASPTSAIYAPLPAQTQPQARAQASPTQMRSSSGPVGPGQGYGSPTARNNQMPLHAYIANAPSTSTSGPNGSYSVPSLPNYVQSHQALQEPPTGAPRGSVPPPAPTAPTAPPPLQAPRPSQHVDTVAAIRETLSKLPAREYDEAGNILPIYRGSMSERMERVNGMIGVLRERFGMLSTPPATASDAGAGMQSQPGAGPDNPPI